MADFYNPYEYRGNKEGILTRTAKAPYRLGRAAITSSPAWAPRVAATVASSAATKVYRSAASKASEIARLRSAADTAYAAHSARVMRTFAPRVNAAAEKVRVAEANLRQRLPMLRKGLTSATEDVRIARGLVDEARTGSEIAKARTIAVNRAKRKLTAKFAPEAKRLASMPVRDAADLANRASVVKSHNKAVNMALKRVSSQFPSYAGANKSAGAAQALLDDALRAQQTAVDAFRTGGNRLRGAVASAREAYQAAGEQATRYAGIAANRAKVSILRRAPTMTGAERAAVAVADGVKSVGTSIGTAASKIGDVLHRVASAVKSSAMEPGLAGRIAASGKAGERVVGAGKSVASMLGKMAGAESKTQGAVKSLGNLVAKGVTGRPIAAAFNKVEAAGKLLTGSSRGVVARSIRGLTNAGGLAGGFALGAWTDAAFNVYDFYKNGGKLSDIGKTTVETVNGKQVAQTNPGAVDILTSSGYWKEVGRGLQKSLTFGLTDGEWLDNIGSPEDMDSKELAQLGKDNAVRIDEAFENMRDINGNRVYSPEELEARQVALKTAEDSSRRAQEFMKQAKGSLDVQNFQTMLGNITAERDAKLDKMEQNLRSFGDFSRTLRRPMSEEDYRKSATNAAESEFNRRVSMLLGNKTAQDVMKMNRKAAYAHYGIGSGDYDADVANATGERLDQLKMFNREWEGQSDADKVTWNVNDAKAAQAEAQAAYAEMEEQ